MAIVFNGAFIVNRYGLSGSDRGRSMRVIMFEKRKFRRRRVLREGRLILAPGSTPIKCIIRDESEGGAKLRVPAQVTLPQSFSLVFVTEGKMYLAQLVWRRDDDAGIQFVGLPQPALADS